MEDFFYNDTIKAVDAKFEAQKLAFAPMAFQATMALRDLGLLKAISDAKDAGITLADLARTCQVSEYGVGVLLEMGLSAGLVKLVLEADPWRFVLGKVGFFVLNDRLTTVNLDFTQDVCYLGMANLTQAIKEGKPAGLKALGDWPTIYEGLSRLPRKAQDSWFAFDHYYSDVAYPDALPIVFEKPVGMLVDIGGNTAKWALTCVRYHQDVKVTIVDLPGQAGMARTNIQAAGAQDRVFTHEANILDPSSRIPAGADVVWMSQFLDCFSLDEVTAILKKVGLSVGPECRVFVLEPFWDKQRFRAATYSLHGGSLYFTAMANGNSKFYNSEELTQAIGLGGFDLVCAHHYLGANAYSLMEYRKRP